jgi:hypothetical protein
MYLHHLVFVRPLLLSAVIAADSSNGCCARTFPNFCVVLCICFVLFCVLFVCICVLYYCHRVATQL